MTRSRLPGLAVLALAILATLVPGSSQAATRRCSGFAPAETRCATGTFSRIDTLSHDVDADFNFVGTVESKLSFAGKERTFRCTYVPGTTRNCISLGEFPDKGQSFSHSCRAIIPGSVVPGVDGVEGAFGLWQCSVTY